MNNTPPINAYGLYDVALPFTIDTVEYRCESIRGFNELAEDGVNVYAQYYARNGLSKTIYLEDEAADINIVTLISAFGPTLHIPSSYIVSFPTNLVDPHRRYILTLDLGLLPETSVFTQLIDDLAQIATWSIGNTVTGAVHATPATGLISKQQGEILAAARLALKQEGANLYANSKKLSDELNAAKTEIGEKDNIIIQLINT